MRAAAAHLSDMDDSLSPVGRNVFVLSGGGSRGAGQVGMLRALLGTGIVPDVLVGGSVGALNACFTAVDPTPDRVEELADRWMGVSRGALTGPHRSIVTNLLRRRPCLYSPDRLRTLIGDWVGVADLADLAAPTRVATTALPAGRPAFHDTGRLVDVLAASTALPALFPPVTLDGVIHVDAGIAENLPLSAAADLARPGDTVWLLDVTKSAQPRHLRTPVDVLVAALAASITNRPHVPFGAGVTVVPLRLDDAYDSGPVFDFTHTGVLFRLGEETATRALLEHRAAA